MGSTVTTGRMAAAFRAQSGAVIYCLYEETYEKNCYPHTPHWSAIYIGRVEGALQQVFNYASCCEGGMLQNRSGWMTPEGYLRSWMSELQSPMRMTRDHSISLYVKTGSFYAPLSQDSLPAVADALAGAGMQDAANRLHAGETVALSLFQHGELISRLHDIHQICAWRLLPDHTRPAAGAERCPSLGIPAAKAKIQAPHHPPALIVSEHGDMILRDATGTWRCGGQRYEIMASYIQSLAPVEQAHPGNCGHLIKSYREHLKAAPRICAKRLLIQTDRQLVTNTWQRERVEEVRALPGATSDGDITIIPFSTEHEYLLCHLPRAATIWRVLEVSQLPSSTSSANQSFSAVSETV